MLRRSALRRLPRIPSFSQRAAYTLRGPPLRIGGKNDGLSHEVLVTESNAVTHEPMRVYAVSGYVSCVYLCHYPEREGRNMLALDCGSPSDASRLDYFIRNCKDVAPDSGSGETDKRSLGTSLNLAVATHSHPDHMGAAMAFRELGADVAMPERIERYYSGFRGRLQMLAERALITAFAYMLGRDRIERPGVRRVYAASDHKFPRLSDSRALPNGFHDWTAVACHGHTGHMVGLWHAATGMLYAADFIIAHKGRFSAPMPVDLPQEYEHTVARLRQLPVRWLLLAHGGVVDVEGVAGGWDQILDDVVEHLNSGFISPAMRLVQPITCLGPERSLYDPAVDRVRGRIKFEDADPVPVMHLK